MQHTAMTLKELSLTYNIPVLDICAYDLKHLPETKLHYEFMLEHCILPLWVADNRLFIAVCKHMPENLLDEVAFITGYKIDLVLVNKLDLLRVLENDLYEYFSKIELDEDIIKQNIGVNAERVNYDSINSHDGDLPIVRFVHKIIYDAVIAGASDIHFEPYEAKYRIRYRIDGVLSEIITIGLELKEHISARIKVVSNLNIAEKRVPQDGRLRLSVSNNQIIDFRVSTLPTLFGEKIVLRILDQSSSLLTINQLGLNVKQQENLLKSIANSSGMILVTGPTGSGKTVTLYSLLNYLNNDARNISTVEDPIEIPISGINQVSVHEKSGITFANTLRAFLRQDPDIIMVGEIRDTETAEIAIKAAQTGHLVISTLHTNDASSGVTRLMNMGITSYNLGDSISIIIAQRLVRKLCNRCKQRGNYSFDELIRVGFSDKDVGSNFQPYVAVGCRDCNGSGYKGRVGVFEVMPISNEIKRLILHNATTLDIAEQAMKDGVIGLRQSGIEKVRLGITSLSEVEANTVE